MWEPVIYRYGIGKRAVRRTFGPKRRPCFGRVPSRDAVINVYGPVPRGREVGWQTDGVWQVKLTRDLAETRVRRRFDELEIKTDRLRKTKDDGGSLIFLLSYLKLVFKVPGVGTGPTDGLVFSVQRVPRRNIDPM